MLAAPETSVVLALAIILIWLSTGAARGPFYSPENLQNLSRQIAFLAVFAVGEAIVIITGGIDLSLGSLIAASGMLLGHLLTRTGLGGMAPAAGITLAVLLVVLAGLLLGVVHATLIHRLRLPPFVVTLASLSILHSGALLVNQQLPIPLVEYPQVLELGNGRLYLAGSNFGVPIPVVIVLVVAILGHLILRYTRPGRHVYSVGSNEEATRLSGVQVYRVKLFAYGASGALGALAGVLYASYGTQGDPLLGVGYELNAVAAAVIGGCSLAGGRGSVLGTLLGACLLNVILSAINLTIERPTLWEGLVVGGVLLAAMLFNTARERLLRG